MITNSVNMFDKTTPYNKDTTREKKLYYDDNEISHYVSMGGPF